MKQYNMKNRQKQKGILAILCAAFCFALMTAFVRLAGDLPSVQKSFFRNLVALLFAAAVLLRTEEKFVKKTLCRCCCVQPLERSVYWAIFTQWIICCSRMRQC